MEKPVKRIGAIKELELKFWGLGGASIVSGKSKIAEGDEEKGLANRSWRAMMAAVVFSWQVSMVSLWSWKAIGREDMELEIYL
ncbi:UNVERIFIED_CONTAM: hypothetical protein Sangu_1309000 [Sesamum angustifolium]|uniref:Uncharacterized protein n=1 Tax=Sesamum angustifolium TaxID=2727405 RepID=A0AAW2NNU1_9LAMI